MRQAQALQIMLSGESVFLTGAPGAGKTFVLNQFIRRAQRAGKSVAVTASTGIAATHIGGTTIHSWSGLGIRDRLSEYDKEWLKANDRLRKRYNSVDILVIDEISMLHGSRLDMVNDACKVLRDNPAPFGGLQVILVGDLFQLPPVSRLSELTDFAHTSAAWTELDPRICYITEQHRQQGDALLELLEAMRSGTLDQMHIEALQSRHGQKPTADTPVTRLFTHNIDVESINQRHLQALPSEAKRFTMQTKGTAAKIEQLTKSVLAPEQLDLKIGAEVMFVANDFAAGFVNGSRGRVVDFENNVPVVRLVSGKTIKVEPHSWTLTEDGRKRAEVVQLPLRLAWAITIHKSQGMSLDAAEIDLSKSFTPGMGYVALSRVRTLGGIYLTGINNLALQLHPEIFEFDRHLQSASEVLAAQTLDAPELEEAAEEQIETAAGYDQVLFEKLKIWRLQRASRDRVAPFMVAHNTTLEAIATRPPVTIQQLLGIKGFGPAKQAAYGDEIITIVQEHLRSQGSATTSEPRKIFLSTSFSHQVDDNGTVKPAYRKFLIELLDLLRQQGHQVFCAAEYENWQVGQDGAVNGLTKDLTELESTDTIYALLGTQPSAGVQFELGYALAKGKQLVLMSQSNEALSYFNQGLVTAHQATLITYDSTADLVRQLEAKNHAAK